jgi:hypothetical protein
MVSLLYSQGKYFVYHSKDLDMSLFSKPQASKEAVQNILEDLSKRPY